MSATASPRTKPNLTRTVRRAVAAAFLLVIAVFLVVFFTREKKPAASASSSTEKPVEVQKIDEREQVRYSEFRGNREKVEFQADRSYVGPDNLYHLVGHVQITDYGRQGGRKILARSDEIIHDAERTRFTMSGHVQVHLDEASFEVDSLDYSRPQDAFSTDQPIVITSPNFHGTARGMTYSLKDEEVQLHSDVRIEARVSRTSPEPLVLQGRTLRYNRLGRRGRFEDGVTLAHGRSRGSCDSLDFDVFPNTDKLNIIYFRGHVRFHLEGEFADKPGAPSAKLKTDAIQSLGDNQDVEADEIKLRAFLDTAVLHSYESKGKAMITFRSPTRGDTRFRAESIDFIFNEDGALREFRAATDVRMLKTELDGETSTAEGESMLMPGSEEFLQISPPSGGRVTAHVRGSDVVAEVLGFNLKTDDFRAAGVRAVFLPGPDKKPVGLFSAQQPVFVTSQWMEYTAAAKSYRFFGGSRMWQGKSQLFADDSQFAEDTGAAFCQGHVRSLSPHKPKDTGPEEMVEISSGRMRYDPDKNTALYETEAGLKTGAFRLAADRLRVLLSPETKDPQTATALGRVVINQPNREGRGEEAVYHVDDRLLVLTGRPVVTEKDKGETRGDKLTFHLADGTITVENEKRDRSVTKIKS